MGDVLAFTPRPKSTAPELPGPVSPTELRAEIEAGAQAALDMADRFIAILDRLDGETEAPEIAIPETAIEAPPPAAADLTAGPSTIHISPLRWGGRGNVVSFAGVAVLDLSAAAGGALLALARRS